MKVYYSIICLIIAAFSTNGCKKSESSDNKIPDNSEIITTAEFCFISKLSEETLLAQEQEYKLTRDFLKNAFKDKESFYVAYMDRTDNSGLIYTHKLALDTDTWTSFAMNSHKAHSEIEGGTVFFSEPSRKISFLHKEDHTFIQGFKCPLTGFLSKKDSGEKKVKIDAPLFWARFAIQEDIADFSSMMNNIKNTYSDYILVATIKTPLKDAVKVAVESANGRFSELANGKDYTLVIIHEPKYWKSGVMKEKLEITNEISAYKISISW